MNMRRDYIFRPVLRGADVLRDATTEVERYFGEHNGDRCDRWRHYLPVYDRHLSGAPKPVHFLEIGVANGGSFQVWRRYFGDSAHLHGLDISRSEGAMQCLSSVNATLHIGDQKDANVLKAIVAQMGGVIDVVIDDGSHMSADQIASFEILYPLLSPGGVYICEDTHTSYFVNPRPATFVEYAKKKVDELHSWYLDDSERISDAFALMTRSVLFYDSMVVFERALPGKTEPRRVVVGRDP